MFFTGLLQGSLVEALMMRVGKGPFTWFDVLGKAT